MRAPRLLTILAITLCGVFSLARSASADQNIYLAPGGNDGNRGTTPDQSALTLARAQDIAIALTQRAPDNITIHIAPGTYREQKVVWHYSVPGHRIQILGRPDDPSTVMFDGNGKGGTFFTLQDTNGKDTHLTISGLTITRYTMAITLNGNGKNFERFNSGTSIVSNRFIDNGGYVTVPPVRAVAVIRLVNSRQNTIAHNIFDGMRAPDCERLHAIYLANYADGNSIYDNHFQNGCGDAIRARDASNYNKIYNNQFRNVGDKAAFSEWFCSQANGRCTKPTPECPSLGNAFHNNSINGEVHGRLIAPTVVHQRLADPSCPRGPALAATHNTERGP